MRVSIMYYPLAAAERHIPKCATTINRPKPPSKVNRFEKKPPAGIKYR